MPMTDDADRADEPGAGGPDDGALHGGGPREGDVTDPERARGTRVGDMSAEAREASLRALDEVVEKGGSDAGMATAEYAIATVAAAGFAGLLLVILRSDEVRGLLLGIVRGALSM